MKPKEIKVRVDMSSRRRLAAVLACLSSLPGLIAAVVAVGYIEVVGVFIPFSLLMSIGLPVLIFYSRPKMAVTPLLFVDETKPNGFFPPFSLAMEAMVEFYKPLFSDKGHSL